MGANMRLGGAKAAFSLLAGGRQAGAGAVTVILRLLPASLCSAPALSLQTWAAGMVTKGATPSRGSASAFVLRLA